MPLPQPAAEAPSRAPVLRARSGVTYANHQVVDYDVAAMLRNGAYKLSSPAFTHPYVIAQAYACVLASIVMAGVIVYTSPRHAHALLDDDEFPELGPHAAHAGAEHDHHHMSAAAGSLHSFFGGLTAFVFGFFVFRAVGNYLSAKSNGLGGLMGALSVRWVGREPLGPAP